jgi:carbon storage regulator CsrA
MLVLRRKVGEEIRLGDGIIVKVLAVNGRAIRLGIEAPTSIPIWRGECAGNGAGLSKSRLTYAPQTSRDCSEP